MRGRRLRKLRGRPLQPTAGPVLLALLALLAACHDSRPAVVLTSKDGASTRVFVEIADTPDTQARGLMYRSHLDPDHGMVFLFDAEKDKSFWMKNTLIPLDMIFISRDGRIVGIHPNAEPFSLRAIRVGVPSQVVLEVNGGFAAAHGLAVGDHVTYRNIASTKLP
jgi:uncharacterized membrane protein (UPF0127 family)